jgi:peptidoglycan/LPS O-acetylase OafA/YrhL
MIDRRLSLYLDGARAGAALLVVLSHWAYERFSGGHFLWIRDLNLGSDAVVLFFVLSGFVIAFTASEKDRDTGEFLFNRATRIYSVALPALLLGYGLDHLGAWAAPAAYDGWWYSPKSLAATLLVGLTFSNEWNVVAIRLGTNGPYWSLSYEVAYYLLFAAAIYLTGLRRIIVIALLALVFGWRVLLLMPAWLLGVLVWRLVRQQRYPDRTAAWTMAVLPPCAYAAALGLGVPHYLMALTQSLLSIDANALDWLLRFSDEFIWNGLIGVLFAIHLLGVAALLARPRTAAAAAPSGTARAIRWMAGASFSLYLVHYPLMQFLEAVLPATLAGTPRYAALLALTLAACLIFAELFERPLARFRAAVNSVLPSGLTRPSA